VTARPDLRLVAPALAVWVVVLALLHTPPILALVLAVTAAVIGVAALSRRPLVGAVLLCVAGAACTTGFTVHGRTSGPLYAAAEHSAAATIEGVVTADPRVVVPKPSSGALAVRQLVVVRIRVERLTAGGRATGVRTPALVFSTDTAWLRLLPSQRVRTEAVLRPAGPGADVAALVSTRGRLEVLSRPSAVQRVAGSLRAGLRRAVAPLPEAERGLLPGLVDGDVSALPPALQDDFRTVGLTHLTAVSGTNVAVVLGAVLLLCGLVGVPRRVRPGVALLALAGFVVLARPSPSVLRAAVMGSIALLALTTSSRRSVLPALSAAVVLLLLVLPDLAAAPGFALSVLATAGLVILAPGWRDRWSRRMPRWLAEALAVPAAAQVTCGPIVAALSGQLGLLAVPANLLAVPAVAPATVLGLAAAVVAPVCGPLAHLIAWLAWLPTTWLVRIATTGAALPGAALPWWSGLLGGALMVVATLAVAVVLRLPRVRRVLAAVTTGVLTAAALLWWMHPGWPPEGWFLVACDVGQGDGLVLAAGPHTAMVVDTGPDPKAMARCLRRLHVRSVPLVLLTHLHADHVEGLPAVLRGHHVGQVQIGPLDEPAVELARVRQWTSDRRVPLVRAVVGEQGSAGQARWQVLAPDHAHHGTNSDPNNSSLVLRLTAAGGVTVLLTGDVEKEAQQALLDLGVPLRADVLKVPHHGSSHQLPAFLDAVGARLAMTSVGVGNPYGHPAPETLRHVGELGARSYRTDRDGDVALVQWSGVLSAVARRGAGVPPITPPTGLATIPGTTLTASAEALWSLPINWCGGRPPVARARSPGYFASGSG
jgi:competence protein ComEC